MADGGSFTVHALQRAYDRWGFVPTVGEADRVILDIIEGRSRHWGTDDAGAEFHEVRMRGQGWPVVYSPPDAKVVTVYDPGSPPSPKWSRDPWWIAACREALATTPTTPATETAP